MPEQTKIAELPVLTNDEMDDALFRVRDRLWASLGDLFDRQKEEQGLTYAELARRINRTRSQVQRWLGMSHNMTVASAGLLAEGMDADLEIVVTPRKFSAVIVGNYAHPCEDARMFVMATARAPIQANAVPALMTAASTKTSAKPADVASEWHFHAN
ncbi:MAG: helix-turn-helix transcriptional regulator [Brevundimonas sp.]|nr:helix-turn-helix transcriptional regulator [Brevundimonas sp.]